MKQFTAYVFLLLLTSCASHPNVRPGVDGLHKVIVRGPEKTVVEEAAISQARNYCEEMKKNYAVISENTHYTGSMDENSRKVIRQASKTASVLGGWKEGSGERNDVGTAGDAGVLMTDDDVYVCEMSFKCQ